MRKWLLLILLILISQQRLYAQQPAYFMFGQDQFEGVAIYSIIQDHKHNYYFATNHGLYIHDGYNFEKVACEKMKSHSVFNFVIDSKGVIYCTNLNQQVFKIENGICSLIFEIPDNGIHLNLIINKEDELYISTSRKVYVLNEQHKLVYSPKIKSDIMFGPPFLLDNGKIVQHLVNTNQLFVYANKEAHFETLHFPLIHDDADNFINFLKIGKTTYIINNINKEIFRINFNDYSSEKVNKKITEKTALLRYYRIDSTIWVCNQISGALLLNEQLKGLHQSEKIFNNYFISYVYKDHEGNILLATFNQGIIVIPDKEIKDINPTFSDYNITRVIKGAGHELLFGTSEGGILKYDGKLSILSTASNKGMEYLFYWPKHNLILEDTREMTVHIPGKKLFSLREGSLKCAIEIKENELLIALNSGVRKIRFDPKTGTFQKDKEMFHERSYGIVQEPNSDKIYVSTASGLRYKVGNTPFKILTDGGEPIRTLYLTIYKDMVIAASAKHGMLFLKNGKVLKRIAPIFNEDSLSIFKLIIQDDFIYANTQFPMRLGYFK